MAISADVADFVDFVDEKDVEVLWKREISAKLFEKINLTQYGLSSSEVKGQLHFLCFITIEGCNTSNLLCHSHQLSFSVYRQIDLITRAQANLAAVLDSKTANGASDAKTFCSVLMKLASNSRSTDVDIQQYVFTRVEEILGLSVDLSDVDCVVYGHHRAGLKF